MLDKVIDIIIVFTGFSFAIPVCLYFWINCIDFVIDKIKEWF